MKKQKGITLIALIITIIVMLILVGVTISVALNGGLFKTAQEATTNTLIEAEKEQLLSAVVAAIGDNAKVNFGKLDANLPNDEWIGGNGEYTSPKGNDYTVTEDGIITKKSPSNIRYVYDAGSDQYIVVLKDNYTTVVMNGQDIMKLGTYTENVNISELSAYNGYDKENGIENYSTFILQEDGTISYAISDDKSEIYLVKNYTVEQDGTITTKQVSLADKKGNLTNDVDLSDVTFNNQ